MNAREILEQAVREDVSDIFIVAGLPVSCRKNGNIIQTQEEKLFPKETEALLNEIYGMAGDRDMMNLLVHGDDDFSFAIPGVSRFRVSAYKQRGALSAVIRVITFQLPNPQELGIPEAVMQFADHQGHDPCHRLRRQWQVHHPCLPDRPHQQHAKYAYYYPGRPVGIPAPSQQEHCQSARDQD